MLSPQDAGWVGCNILLSQIPPEGRIPIVLQGKEVAKEEVRLSFAKTERLIGESLKSRSWAATLLLFIHKIGKEHFSINDIYSFESELGALYPSNRHIKAKIRQQLQVLRDAGWLEFAAKGVYRLTQNTEYTRSR